MTILKHNNLDFEILQLIIRNKVRIFGWLNLTIALLLGILFFLSNLTKFALNPNHKLLSLILVYSVPGTLQLIVSALLIRTNSSKFHFFIFLAPISSLIINLKYHLGIYPFSLYYLFTLVYIDIVFFNINILHFIILTIPFFFSNNLLKTESYFKVLTIFSQIFIDVILIASAIFSHWLLKAWMLTNLIYKLISSNEELLNRYNLLYSLINVNKIEVSERNSHNKNNLSFGNLSFNFQPPLKGRIEKFFIRTFIVPPLASFFYIQREIEKKERKIQDIKKLMVNTIELRDPYTRGHSSNVTYYSYKIGKHLNLGEKELEKLVLASELHDIGKIVIPDSILLKPYKLSKDEFEVIKTHTIIGYEILKPIEEFKEIATIIKYHHEKYDGSGYPEALKGDNIPLLSRIITIADVFDALTTDRPYRKAFSAEEAIRIMIKEHQKYDEKILDTSIDILLNAYKDIKNRKLNSYKLVSELDQVRKIFSWQCQTKERSCKDTNSELLIKIHIRESLGWKSKIQILSKLIQLAWTKDISFKICGFQMNRLFILCNSLTGEVLEKNLKSLTFVKKIKKIKLCT